MLGLEGPESYQPGYATSARLWCLRSRVGHEPIISPHFYSIYIVFAFKLSRRDQLVHNKYPVVQANDLAFYWVILLSKSSTQHGYYIFFQLLHGG